jgi:hypothetical protein
MAIIGTKSTVTSMPVPVCLPTASSELAGAKNSRRTLGREIADLGCQQKMWDRRF